MEGFGFGRLWEGFEKPWGALGGCGFSIVCFSPRLWEALGSFGSLWEVLGGSGRLWKALVCFGRLWEALEGLVKVWKAWEGFGRRVDVLGCFERFWEALAASVRLCKALDALEGFGGFESLWQVRKTLGRFSEALRGFGKL